jgi:hypothetical protein
MRVMTRVVAANMSARTPSRELPDGSASGGLRRRLADARSAAGGTVPGRSMAGSRSYCCSTPAAAARATCSAWASAAGGLDAAFITHFHSDHIDGLGETFMLRWTGGAHRRTARHIRPAGHRHGRGGLQPAPTASMPTYRTAHHGHRHRAASPASGGRRS